MYSLPRRRLLSGGAVLAASAATLAAPVISRALGHNGADENAATTVVVRWNTSFNRWASRPAKAEFGVVFLSTNDANATAPKDPHMQTGDVWRRHPDAVAS
jgi:hypothetical protein